MRQKIIKNGNVIFLPEHEAIKKDYFENFQKTLQKHYKLTITNEQYRKCSNSFIHLLSVTSALRLGYVIFNTKKIWVMYNSTYNVLETAIDHIVESDFDEFMRYAFTSQDYQTALYIYKQYQKEREWIRKDFLSKKEMALYYQKNTKFASFHILAYVGKETPVNLIKAIYKIIHNIKK